MLIYYICYVICVRKEVVCDCVLHTRHISFMQEGRCIYAQVYLLIALCLPVLFTGFNKWQVWKNTVLEKESVAYWLVWVGCWIGFLYSVLNFFMSSIINQLYLLNFCHIKPHCYLLFWYEIISKINFNIRPLRLLESKVRMMY